MNDVSFKDKHLIPIFDELMNELQGVAYFSKLDFRAGYHLGLTSYYMRYINNYDLIAVSLT